MEQNNSTSTQLLKGMVLDKEMKPLKDILVTVYQDINFRDISKQEEYKTKQDGSYKIECKDGNSIMLRFDSNNWHPALINNLSGTMDHNINIVMQKVGLAYNQDELLDILSVYERLYFIDEVHHGAGPISLDEKRSEYRRNLGMMKHLSPITQERHKQVVELYRKK